MGSNWAMSNEPSIHVLEAQALYGKTVTDKISAIKSLDRESLTTLEIIAERESQSESNLTIRFAVEIRILQLVGT